MVDAPKLYLTRSLLLCADVREGLKAERVKRTHASSLDSLPDIGLSQSKVENEKPRDRSVQHSLVLHRIDSKLLNHRGKELRRIRRSVDDILSKIPLHKAPILHRQNVRKLASPCREPSNYTSFIRCATTKWNTLGFATSELKQDYLSQRKMSEMARISMQRLKRKKARAMPNVISYGSVTSLPLSLKLTGGLIKS